jgi:hypothetical protein
MGIVRKRVGGREYIYLSIREGGRVVHKYLGPADAPRVARVIGERMESSGLPENLLPLFWDTSPGRIHIMRNARYIIERVLEFGDVDAVAWLQRVYPVQKIIDALRLSRVVTDKSREFWKIWFGVRDA